MRTSIKQIDDIIHAERISPQNEKITYLSDTLTLPDGTFVLLGDDPYLIKSGWMHQWTPFGYERKVRILLDEMLKVLTPKSIVNAFRSGYTPTSK